MTKRHSIIMNMLFSLIEAHDDSINEQLHQRLPSANL